MSPHTAKNTRRASFKANLTFEKKKFFEVRPDTHKKWSVAPSGAKIQLQIEVRELRARLEYLMDILCDHSTSVNVRFCDLEEMSATNAHFRGKAYATDVLSFPAKPGSTSLDEAPAGQIQTRRVLKPKEMYLLGDVLICMPVCFAQAKARRQSCAAEFERMLVHGLVHLKGFDHERGEDAWRVMSLLEKGLIRELQRQWGPPLWAQATSVSRSKGSR